MAKGDYGFNGSISAEGYGSRRIRVTRLQLGLRIIANEEEARNRRAFYSVVTTGSSFTFSLIFVSWEEREAFNRWIRGFMEDVAEGTAPSGFMTVQVPSRKFFRTAVPETGIEYGKGVTDVAYEMSIGFIGASDPIDLDLGKRQRTLSYFKGPQDPITRFFYPAGRQVRGAESLDGTIFDPDRLPGVEPFPQGPYESPEDRLERFGQDPL